MLASCLAYWSSPLNSDDEWWLWFCSFRLRGSQWRNEARRWWFRFAPPKLRPNKLFAVCSSDWKERDRIKPIRIQTAQARSFRRNVKSFCSLGNKIVSKLINSIYSFNYLAVTTTEWNFPDTSANSSIYACWHFEKIFFDSNEVHEIMICRYWNTNI